VGSTLSAANLESALSNPAVSTVLGSPTFASLVSTVDNAAAVPDYCGLLLNLPSVPVPASWLQVPGSVLSQTLAALPAGTLGEVLNSLPAGTLTSTFSELSPSTAASVLNTMSGTAAGQMLVKMGNSGSAQLGSLLFAGQHPDLAAERRPGQRVQRHADQ
jgi:hypothetical protein